MSSPEPLTALHAEQRNLQGLPRLWGSDSLFPRAHGAVMRPGTTQAQGGEDRTVTVKQKLRHRLIPQQNHKDLCSRKTPSRPRASINDRPRVHSTGEYCHDQVHA
jgi:hypothetical protein